MPPISSEMLAIAKDAGCNVFVESGTYMGVSFRRALRSQIFERCYSVEIVPELYRSVARAYPEKPSRKVFLGRSHEVFRDQVLPLCSPSDRIFFWLDGHFSGGDTGGAEFPCPLLEELEAIREHCPTESIVIAIDDTDDFGRKNANVLAWNWPTRAEIEDAARSINRDFFCLDYTGAEHRRKVHRGALVFSTHQPSSRYYRQHCEDETSITIFATPKPFRGHHSIIQCNAIRSWKLLEPRPDIILFGDEESTVSAAAMLGVGHSPGIRCSKEGTPLISAIFEQAQRMSSCRVLVYLNSDMILTSDFLPAVSQAARKFEDFLMVGQRWDVDIQAPLEFAEGWEDQLYQKLIQRGAMHPVTGIDYFAFTKHLWPHIPPFAVGRVGWDNWMIYDCLASQRPVIDASRVVTAAHQNHDFSHLADGWEERTHGIEAQRNLALARECLATGKVIGFTSHASWKFTPSGRIVPAQ